MTAYAGSEVRLAHTATRDKVALVPADVEGVYVSIYSKDWLTVVVAETPMTWNAAKARWEFLWDTADVEPAVYRVKARIQGLDGLSVWAYGRKKIVKDPLAA